MMVDIIHQYPIIGRCLPLRSALPGQLHRHLHYTESRTFRGCIHEEGRRRTCCDRLCSLRVPLPTSPTATPETFMASRPASRTTRRAVDQIIYLQLSPLSSSALTFGHSSIYTDPYA